MLEACRLRPPGRIILVVIVAFCLLHYYILPYSWASYITRPIWDKTEAPSDLIPHLFATTNGGSGAEAQELCGKHGWSTRGSRPEVWDAVIFSTELDLLLIRLHELDPIVSKFFLIESTHSFTGIVKPSLLLPTAIAGGAFDAYRSKIVFKLHQGGPLKPGEGPFAQEIRVRGAMTDLLRQHHMAPEEEGQPVPVMIFSDIDELVSRDTVELLRTCDFHSPLHLGLRDYMYTWEFEAGVGPASSWRASAVEWPERGQGSDEFYRHGKVTERCLEESGWHCSWCFRTLKEFATKALGYSHVDRLGNRPNSLLRPKRIQQTICEGSDIFGMLPEAYSWREMAAKWRLIPAKNLTTAPALLKEHPEYFPYLVPGGCKRQDAEDDW